MRKIGVVTGTRAEYGILHPVMKAIESHPRLSLHVLVTGMHLMPEFGYTVEEIERDGFAISARVPMYLSGDTNAVMVRGVGIGIIGIVQALEQIEPDIVVVLGDRGEPLAAAIAAAYMNIPVAHIHGGDSTAGACIDESTRHAITRFAHIHFPATPASAQRLVRTGEEPWRIHVVGALGIYALGEVDFIPKDELCKHLNLNADEPIILVTQHSVTTQVEKAAEQMCETMEALVELGQQAVVIYPGVDAGGKAIIQVIKEYETCPFIKTFSSLPYLTFVSLMRSADVMVGNSSAAIVDAPLFSLPAVNVGNRQEHRERGANIIDVPPKREEIIKAVEKAITDQELRRSIQQASNPYDIEPNGAGKIADILSTIQINENLLQKKIIY